MISSDWHGDAVTAGLRRYEDLVDAVTQTVAVAKREQVDTYVFAGDLCDPDTAQSHRSVGLAVRTAMVLWAEGISSRWLVGNHDVVEDGTGSSVLDAVGEIALEGYRGHARPIATWNAPAAEGEILALPYPSRARAYDPLRFVREVDAEPALVVGHLSVHGAQLGSESKEFARGRELVLPVAAIRERWPRAMIVNGHYHRRQVTQDGVQIPGSLVRLKFGEEDNVPSYLIVETP